MIYILSTRKEEITKSLRDDNNSFLISENLDFVSQLDPNQNNYLIAHNTNLIVPSEVLRLFDDCFNIHAASPEFPGRDPHHWAIFQNAKEYGATLHRMTQSVDSGEIFNYISFPCSENDTPQTLLHKANAISLDLLRQLVIDINSKSTKPKILGTWKWSINKKTRKDFYNITDCTNDEIALIERKIKAFSHPDYTNLYVRKGPYIFYLKK